MKRNLLLFLFSFTLFVTASAQSKEYQNVTGYYVVREYQNGQLQEAYRKVTLKLMIIDTSESGLLTYGGSLKIYVTAYKYPGQDWNKLYTPIQAGQSTNRDFSYVVSLSLGIYGVVWFDY
ncbi:MAG: hypothetical protein FWF46_09600 [Oscillospiraceae bacterium]|nr:hypothetical protein [Oscillospiraceae bacterium]